MGEVIGLKIKRLVTPAKKTFAIPRGPRITTANRRDYDFRRRLSAVSRETHRYRRMLRHDPCAFCGAREFLDVDHIVPLSQGGDDDWTNMAGACPRCNRGRRERDLLTTLSERL